ncbi:alpha/beta hydrolase [Kribbella sp. NPDC005582]|uniref:alpha/beta fold hydrolase n=1 Tax=Kribbella sp. NPDC005582 TaxID=3156893 RepID=UPI0033A28488
MNLEEYGAGRPILLLHGGGGPQTVAPFGAQLADELGVRVVVPTHPGFGGTTRPDDLTTIAGLARRYVDLLDELDLTDVTVIGNSIGGWIAAELALLQSPRVSRLVVVDGVGIEVPGHPVADFFSLTFPEVAQLSYHDPERFRIDPTALPPEAQAVLAGNRAALAVYAEKMVDPSLRERLGDIAVPTLVVWGDADRIADPDYGRAYAAAVPGARFELLPQTGHLPQLESPELLIDAVQRFW